MADQDVKATGELLRSLRKRRRKPVTVRHAAGLAGLSPGRWSQIEKGAMTVGGQEIVVRAPSDTLARMVLALGGEPDELVAAGREDAAEELAELYRHNPRDEHMEGFDGRGTTYVVPGDPPVREPSKDEQSRDRDRELESWIEQIRATALPEHVKTALVAFLQFDRDRRDAL